MPQERPVAERFWEKVAVSSDPNACWEWTASRYSKGYGFFRRRSNRILGVAGSTVGAHRMAWELTNGPIPEGRQILHHCDNPPCCNPAHLHLGDNDQNMKERVERERQGKKLDREKAAEIRRLYATGEMNQPEIVAAFGISRMVVSQTIRGEIWKSADGPTGRARPRDDRQRKKLNTQNAREIRLIAQSGTMKQSEIAKLYGVSTGTVYLIQQDRIWKDSY